MTGQHPKTLRTAEEVVAERTEQGLGAARTRRRATVPIAERRNRDLSRFGPAE